MYPLNSIIDFLVGGAGRLPEGQRADALCSLMAEMIATLGDDEVVTAREIVIARCWQQPALASQLVDLIDGHLALRELFPQKVAACSDDEL